MQHSIIMVTLDSRIPSGGSGIWARQAFYNKSNIDFTGARLDTLLIDDDNDGFSYLDTSKPSEDRQTLIEPVIFGHGTEPLPAGTQLSAYMGTIIEDSDGNRFYAFFPALPAPNDGSPEEIGDRYSALIMPVATLDADGNPVWPEFDPSKRFDYKARFTFPLNGVYAIPYQPVDGGDTPPCFTLGTLIETAQGDRLIETLRPGDMVLTRDNDQQCIRWIGRAHLDARRLDLQPNLRPIRIRAGAIGPGMPAQDLIVSPQHRILVRSAIAERMFHTGEVLVAAKHLLGLSGIEVLNPAEGVVYLHLLLDRHEILNSNGAWSESLYTGPQAIRGLPPAARRELRAIFPELNSGHPPTGARRFLSGREGRRLALRHGKNSRDLVTAGP